MSDNYPDNPLAEDEEWPRLTALVYDPEEAAKHISERMAMPLEKARSFIATCDEYELLLGVAPIYEQDDAEEISRAQSEHADLLPPDVDGLDYNLLRAYVERTTELTSAEVVNMIAENVGYYVRQNIMEPEAYEDVRAWADEIMTAITPQ